MKSSKVKTIVVECKLKDSLDVKEFEIDSVIYTNNDITSLLESINAFYVKSRLTSLRNPDEKTLDIWDEIEKLMLE